MSLHLLSDTEPVAAATARQNVRVLSSPDLPSPTTATRVAFTPERLVSKTQRPGFDDTSPLFTRRRNSPPLATSMSVAPALSLPRS
jgi:hypothetical protein